MGYDDNIDSYADDNIESYVLCKVMFVATTFIFRETSVLELVMHWVNSWFLLYYSSDHLSSDLLPSVTRPEFFLGRPVHISDPRRCRHGWRRAEKFSKFVPPNTLKMHSLALSVLRFLCKTFPKSLKLSLRKTLFRGWFSKISYIQIKKLYGYKLVRAAKWYELKRCSK